MMEHALSVRVSLLDNVSDTSPFVDIIPLGIPHDCGSKPIKNMLFQLCSSLLVSLPIHVLTYEPSMRVR